LKTYGIHKIKQSKAHVYFKEKKHVKMFQVILHAIVLSLLLIIPIIISVAFFTLAERKVMAAIQRRKGPNVVGI
jgi:NADH:ubiquinone oxidoreductase subunit H